MIKDFKLKTDKNFINEIIRLIVISFFYKYHFFINNIFLKKYVEKLIDKY